MLDIVDKIANIIIAAFTLLFSIYIYFTSKNKERQYIKEERKVDFFKTIVLENNMSYFFSFHDTIMDTLSTYRGTNLLDSDKVTINLILIEELSKYRKKFYGLLFPLDRSLYTTMKVNSDDLVDILTRKINDTRYNYLADADFQKEIEDVIIEYRDKSLGAIYCF